MSLLIPGAGFIKAIMAIKDLIVFFVESAIMLIPAITEAILALAAGSVVGVAKAIEFGLSKLIALVINLFAKLIGLGGLSKKVMAIFTKIRKRVDKAVMKLLNKAKKAGRKLMRKLGAGKKKAGGKEELNESQNEIKLKQNFSMAGSSHTLTTIYKNKSVNVTMASKNPGNIVTKVKNEIKEHEEIVSNTNDNVKKSKHKVIISDLKEIISIYNTNVNNIKGLKDFDKIRNSLTKLSDTLLKKVVEVGNKHGLKDFIYDVLDIQPSLNMIEKIIKTQFEKHTYLHGTRGSNAIGDGYNNTAMAAENALGWVHDTGKKHTVKSMDSLAKIQTEREKLDEISSKTEGQVGIKNEEWYLRGKQTEEDTQKAISSPLSYLTNKGQLQIYLDDIKRQRNEGKNVGFNNVIKKYKL